MPAHSPEFSFLLTCLRAALQIQDPPATPAPQIDCPANLDWRAFLELAHEQSVITLVYPPLADRAPDEFAEAWHECWATAQMHTVELSSVLADFAGAGIDVLPLKGPVLAESLYGDVAARRSADLDILVRAHEFPAAKQILVDAGFIPYKSTIPSYHLALERDSTTIELHSALARPRLCPLSTDDVWNRSLSSSFQGQPIRIMSPEDSILYLCYHLLRHECSRLLWIADVARALQLLAAHDSGDTLLRASRQTHLDRILLFAAALCSATLLTPLPAAIAAALEKEPKITAQARIFLEQSLDSSQGSKHTVITWNFYSAEPSLWRRWRKRLGELAPTPSDRLWAKAHRIPAPLVTPLLPAIRAIRIVTYYGFLGACRNFMRGTR
jgi:Uncharacterised nucleotidyltransferase